VAGLVLSFLGPPLIRVDGVSIELRLRRPMALLAYLAVTAQRHSRDELAELLYPGGSRGGSRSGLRRALSTLQVAIGQGWLAADRNGVCLAPGPDRQMDVHVFRSLVAKAKTLDKAGDAARAAGKLAEAVRLYRGEFLAGFFLDDASAFEDWQLGEAESLRKEQAAALMRLAEMHEAAAEYAEAATYGRQLLGLDPLEESVHRILMRVHARAGSRSEALRQYDRCRRVLERELGQAPDEETERIREAIVSGKIGAAPPRPVSTGLPASPARTLGAPPDSLPMQPTPFMGRETELEAVVDALRQAETRLVTLTGPGGCGKTRLGLEAAAELRDCFDQGVYFVDLAPVHDPAHVLLAVAAALRISQGSSGRRPLPDVLNDFIRDKRMLLVLDNFEHLLAAAPDVAGILAACPHVKVLATSREALRLRAEHEIPVPPLRLPVPGDPAGRLRDAEAVRFFERRAAAVRPDFRITDGNVAAVAGICIRLDGLPLALELAAARLKALTPESLLVHLDARHALAIEGARDLPARQRTLRAEIDWSHDLLQESDRRLFRRLSVFASGFSFEAAEAVCGFDTDESPIDVLGGLVSLVEKNLLERRDDGEGLRYSMLQTVREYALEHLETSGESLLAHQGFAHYFGALVEDTEPGLYGADQAAWLARLDADYSNIIATLEWLRRHGVREQGIRMSGVLGWFWVRRARLTEGQYWLKAFHDAAAPDDPPGPRAPLTYYLGWMGTWIYRTKSEYLAARGYLQESFELSCAAGAAKWFALSLSAMGYEHPALSQEQRWALLEESVETARKAGDQRTLAYCLIVAYSIPDRSVEKPDSFKKAAIEEALELARKCGDPFMLAEVTKAMGNVLHQLGDHAAAVTWMRESARLARESDNLWTLLDALRLLGLECLCVGNTEEAKERLREGLRMAVDLSAGKTQHELLHVMSDVAAREGRGRRAMRLRAAATLIWEPDARWPRDSMPMIDLPAEAATAEWEAARSMTPEAAVAYALADAGDEEERQKQFYPFART
jgi:predicted ATPase/DNA-binding SARP family transcriptional activator